MFLHLPGHCGSDLKAVSLIGFCGNTYLRASSYLHVGGPPQCDIYAALERRRGDPPTLIRLWLSPAGRSAVMPWLPHARGYLAGMVFGESFGYRPLPVNWQTVAYSGTTPDSALDQDKLTINTTFDGYHGIESSRLYIASQSVDLEYPFFYYEIYVKSLSGNNGARRVKESMHFHHGPY